MDELAWMWAGPKAAGWVFLLAVWSAVQKVSTWAVAWVAEWVAAKADSSAAVLAAPSVAMVQLWEAALVGCA